MTGPSHSGKRRRSHRRKDGSTAPGFWRIVLLFAIPVGILLAATAYVRYLTPPQPTRPAGERALESSLETALRNSGVATSRIRNTGSEISVESTDSLEAVEQRLRKTLPNATFSRDGQSLIVRDGAEKRKLVIHSAVESDSGKGRLAVGSSPAPLSRRGEIVIILDDVGFERQPIDDAVSIAAPLNFAVIPGTPQAEESARRAHQSGHEVLCHLPMEPVGFPKTAPGANAILTSMSDDEIQALTLSSLESIPYMRGVNNHMGSRATTDRRVMREVLTTFPQGTYFIDSRTTPRTVAEAMARELNIRTAGRDVFLDDDRREGSVRHQLARLVAVSEERGTGIGIGHMYPTTIRVLREEIPRLQKAGFEFVHASRVVR